MDEVAPMDGGSLLFLLIAFLGVVADWIGKRRKARAQETSTPVAPARRSTPSASQDIPHPSPNSARAYRHLRNPPTSQPSGLFDRLKDELRKVAEAAEITEVIDERPSATTVAPPPLPKSPPSKAEVLSSELVLANSAKSAPDSSLSLI